MVQRRGFLQTTAAMALGGVVRPALGGEQVAKLVKAEHCVFLWLGGGMSQIDTFDPKKVGDAKKRVSGSYYPSIETAVPGVRVCEHLSKLAPLMDRVTAVRTIQHDVVDEHAAATIRVHTGRPTSGTIQYPSFGSVVANRRPAEGDVPSYVVIGYPNVARGPGFLGPKSGYIYLTEPEAGPSGLQPPPGLTTFRQSRRQELLSLFRDGARERGSEKLQAYDEVIAEAQRLASGRFMTTFDLSSESAGTREMYGEGLGERCLLARRLVESGVRFVAVSHNLNFRNGTGWDTHNAGQLNQHLLIQELDRAVSSLIVDLQRRGLLDKTLIAIGTEFGRPAAFDGGGGRGHHSKNFSLVLAGGGLKHCGGYGQSDELAQKALENPVSIPDFHATIYAALGIDPFQLLHDPSNRPVPITDGGKPIAALFA